MLVAPSSSSRRRLCRCFGCRWWPPWWCLWCRRGEDDAASAPVPPPLPPPPPPPVWYARKSLRNRTIQHIQIILKPRFRTYQLNYEAVLHATFPCPMLSAKEILLMRYGPLPSHVSQLLTAALGQQRSCYLWVRHLLLRLFAAFYLTRIPPAQERSARREEDSSPAFSARKEEIK